MACTSQIYAEDMAIRLVVLYITYATSSRGKTCDIITLAQFEEGGLLSETRDNTESSNEYYDDSILTPLISEE